MIKKEDLMIGDWVKVNYVKFPHPMQVDGLEKNSGSYYALFPKWELSVIVDKLEPIPITAEILEKNGFKGDGYAILSIDKFSWLEYYYYERRLRKKWRGVDEWQNHAHVTDITFQCHCSYVHELQHALRLCGIKKEIIL